MPTLHHPSFVITILGSTQRLFRSKRKSLLASHQIDAHTMKDILRVTEHPNIWLTLSLRWILFQP